jgi:hypothetical protein
MQLLDAPNQENEDGTDNQAHKIEGDADDSGGGDDDYQGHDGLAPSA